MKPFKSTNQKAINKKLEKIVRYKKGERGIFPATSARNNGSEKKRKHIKLH